MYSVGIHEQSESCYPARPPYNPSEQYPESPLNNTAQDSNPVYASVRRLFYSLGYDKEHYNAKDWNPFGWLIKPGETVFIKPNMITEKHLHNNDWEYVITHGSVIRAVVDYTYIALKGRGKIIIGDGPQTNSDFDKIIAHMGLKEIRELYNSQKNFTIDIIDLRKERWIEKDGICIDTLPLAGDPAGSVKVNLGKDSMFSEFDGQGKTYYGALYDVAETNEHHSNGKHEYLVSRSPLMADVFINIPKLKTHKKCGITVNLKSLVGINANKNFLPHYIIGSPETGGDQFDRGNTKSKLENVFVLAAKKMLLWKNPLIRALAIPGRRIAHWIFGKTEKVIRSGNWHGNDTVWRMCLDLNRILMYANGNGELKKSSAPKKFFSIVDGIVSMEGDGPIAGTRKNTGVLIAGDNPAAVDMVCATVMGFAYNKLKLISEALNSHNLPLVNEESPKIAVISNNTAWNKSLDDINYNDTFHFKPHFGWLGKIEMKPRDTTNE